MFHSQRLAIVQCKADVHVYRSIRRFFFCYLGLDPRLPPPPPPPLTKLSGSAHALSEYYDNGDQC